MSWLFSQALVASLAGTFSDGEPCAPLSVMPTPHKFWRNDKTMEPCKLSRFGLMCAVLTDDRGEELLTSFLAAFPARTCPSPGQEKGLTEKEADCGQSSPGLLAMYDRVSHSLKTAQGSLFSDSTECSVTLPRSGTMRSGCVYQRSNSARITSVTESGYSLEKMPTPTVSGNYNRKGAGAHGGDGLATYVRKYPTPTATCHKGWSKGHNRAQSDDRLDYTVEREACESGQPGRLNPEWVEWLMGWPAGWTELKPLEMARFQEWRQQHSPHYQVAHKARMKAIDEELILTAEAVLGESDGH